MDCSKWTNAEDWILQTEKTLRERGSEEMNCLRNKSPHPLLSHGRHSLCVSEEERNRWWKNAQQECVLLLGHWLDWTHIWALSQLLMEGDTHGRRTSTFLMCGPRRPWCQVSRLPSPHWLFVFFFHVFTPFSPHVVTVRLECKSEEVLPQLCLDSWPCEGERGENS